MTPIQGRIYTDVPIAFPDFVSDLHITATVISVASQTSTLRWDDSAEALAADLRSGPAFVIDDPLHHDIWVTALVVGGRGLLRAVAPFEVPAPETYELPSGESITLREVGVVEELLRDT